MKKLLFTGLLTTITSFLFAQSIDNIINAKEVERVEKILSSDDMKGRKVFTPDIDKAADFIAGEFKRTGLSLLTSLTSYKQSFELLKPTFKGIDGKLDNVPVSEQNAVVITSKESVDINENSGYEVGSVNQQDMFFDKANGYIQSGKNMIVLVDTSLSRGFARLPFFRRQVTPNQATVIFILSSEKPKTFSIHSTYSFTKLNAANVVGVLPGKTKPNEYVIFSGHYDHLGFGKPVNGDSLYNGANDDAAGTTAVIMLAKYFKALKKNNRTLIFVAFTAEEIGGYGSQYFSKQLDPEKVKAMFNIEMIGTESKWGRNSAYITGYEKTDMGKILEKNLEGSSFKFYPDPYTEEKLFYRSDNATLARKGVPAHTISTSKMDDEPNYHKPSDEIGTLDMTNMAEIIKAIAISSKSIVSGQDTPSRVKPEAY